MMMDAMTMSEGNVYSASLSADALKGVCVGVLKFATGSYKPVNDLFAAGLDFYSSHPLCRIQRHRENEVAIDVAIGVGR